MDTLIRNASVVNEVNEVKIFIADLLIFNDRKEFLK